MTWFQPYPGAITDLALSCVELVFLIYLLRLKDRTRDRNLVVFIYATAFISQFVGFLAESLAVTPDLLYWVMLLAGGVHLFSVLWCSYRFHENSFPLESRLASLVFIFLFGLATYWWLKDYYHNHRIEQPHLLFQAGLYTAAILWSAINYWRKMKRFMKVHYIHGFFKELRHPSTREVSLFSGFAFSLLLYTLVQVVGLLSILNVIPDGLYWILAYIFSVSITVLVGFAYFTYTREETSFEAKLVGITLLLALSVICIIPVLLFGPVGSEGTVQYVNVFVMIIPATTLLISFFLPLLLRLTLLKQLNKIVTAVKQVGAGDLHAKAVLEVNDEIGRLSQHFNQMTGSLLERTEQLNSMRETIATDFHDQTGNMLSAITRQAGLLKLKLGSDHELQPMVSSIVDNSNSLYASSKDFLWQLNHNSDDPNELFAYLTAYGQHYYNQFDIAFSANAPQCHDVQLDTSAALNLIFIFKEAMTNVAKHSGAAEAMLTMACSSSQAVFVLEDDGVWKQADTSREHYGLGNMERRCRKHDLGYELSKDANGTRITITVPVHQVNAST